MSDTTAPGFLLPSGPGEDDDDALNGTLQVWVRGITGLPGNLVRPRWQAQPPPQPDQNVDWASVGFTTERSDTNAWFGHDPTGDGGVGFSRMQRQQELEATVTFYGPNANRYADLMLDGALIGQNGDVLTAKDIMLAGAGTVRTMPELLGQIWVRRADASFTMRRQLDRVYPIRTIVEVQKATIVDPT